MIQYLLFVTSKLLNVSDITKRIGSFFKLPIQLFYGVHYPELAFTDNKDDHCKNFSFYVVMDNDLKTWRWRLAPAYNLTLCTEGYNGEHATSVNGTGHPRLSDFIAVGKKIKLSEDRCRELIEAVRSGCTELSRYDIKE